MTGEDASDVGDRVEEFVEKWTDDPERLIGPITSIGLNVAGILGALVLILITAYYMAIRPEPLVDGLVSLFPPPRREHVRHVLDRVRRSWIGWMEGVLVDMLATFVLTFIGLSLIGLDFAIFFAVLSALLVVVPYFGSIAGAIPPVLFALTDSPGKALVTLGIYVLVQQIESNVTIPIVMSQRTRMHPAMIAIGVVVVGQLFGFVGLFVAVPILSLIVIADRGVLGQGDRGDRPRAPAQLRSSCPAQDSLTIAMTIPIRTKITIRIWTTSQKRGSSTAAPLLDDRLTQRDGDRVHARVRLQLEDRALGVRLDRLGREPDAPRHLLGVQPLGQQLEDLALALGERGVGADLRHQQRRRERRIHERLARDHGADRPQQVLRRRALHDVPARARGDRIGQQSLVPVGGEHDGLHVGVGLGYAA